MSRPPDGPEGSGASAEVGGVVERGVDRIAHQLRNPLQSITVNLEILRLKASKAVPPEEVDEVERLAGVVNESVRTLDRRIGMLVDLARRSPEEAPRRVALGRFVREVLAAFRLDEREDGPGMEVEVPSEEKDVEVRIRSGWLLVFLLDAAGMAAAGEGTGAVRVIREEDGARLEIPWPPEEDRGGPEADGVRRRLSEVARLAGGEMERETEVIAVRFPAG